MINKNEATNGIHHHHGIVNKKRKEILGDEFHIGQGIFSLNNQEKNNLILTQKEQEIIKPEYTTEELLKYYPNKKNQRWVIYTESKFKYFKNMNQYPNIKAHLDQFVDVITSDNKPYGLHRAREEKFFVGEKIISVRKCSEPRFTYSDFDCYVSATFYVIKTDRINMKFLTTILNSKLMAFWFKHKGKMQGNNYQIDKEPLLALPIYNPPDSKKQPLIDLMNKIIELRKNGDVREIIEIEEQINQLVYSLYNLTPEEIKIVEESNGGK